MIKLLTKLMMTTTRMMMMMIVLLLSYVIDGDNDNTCSQMVKKMTIIMTAMTMVW